MIYARWDLELDRYPAIRAHLLKHREALEARAEVKQGRFAWYALSRYASDYADLFEHPKLLYPDILWQSSFCLAPGGTYTNNTTYLLPTDDAWLLCCLNSPALWSYLWRTAQHGKDEALRTFGEYMITIPIARPTALQQEVSTKATEAIISLTQRNQEATEAVLDLLRVQYDVESTGQALSDFATLGSDPFVQEVKKRRSKKGPSLSPAGLKALRALFDAEAPGILEKRAKILEIERTIAAAVHAAYGLTDADLALLRATAPPRMPPGW